MDQAWRERLQLAGAVGVVVALFSGVTVLSIAAIDQQAPGFRYEPVTAGRPPAAPAEGGSASAGPRGDGPPEATVTIPRRASTGTPVATPATSDPVQPIPVYPTSVTLVPVTAPPTTTTSQPRGRLGHSPTPTSSTTPTTNGSSSSSCLLPCVCELIGGLR